ncbi:MAG: diguanylate cyclase [bacterium]
MFKVDSITPEQFTALTRLAQELNSTLHKSQVIRIILSRCAEISGSPGTCLSLFDEKQEAPEIHTHGISQGLAGHMASLSMGPLRDTASADGFCRIDHLPAGIEDAFGSAFCFSLVHNGIMLGLLYFFDHEESPCSENRMQAMQIFANYAATSVANAVLYEQRERKIRQLNILNEATVSLSSESDTKSLFQKLADHALFLLRSETALLILLTPGSKQKIEQTYISGNLDHESARFQPQLSDILSDMITTQKILNLQSQDLEAHHPDLPFVLPNIHSLLAIPVIHQQTSTGILVLVNKSNAPFFDKEDEDLLMTYGSQAALSIENARLQEYNKRLAITDGLTGLFNHREFQSRMETEVRRCDRYKHPFSLLMIDIDHFKTFNDTYGHPVGDKILQEVSTTIRESIRDIDIPARYGGEEFVVILPETSCDHAQIVAERMRGKIFEKSYGKTLANEEFLITVSIGISTFPGDAEDREELITKCDQALYFAKRDGRNRVRRYDETLKAFIEKKEEHIEDILKDAKVKVMRDLAAAVDAKNLFTRGHTDEVTHYAVALAKALKLSNADIESMHLASILHDIGTVSIPEEILNKPGPLTAEERKIIQGHPHLAEMILQKASHLESIIPVILYHHERYDGKGYPDGLKGEKIPLMARMLSIVEAYQAMCSDRPYRQRRSKQEAIEELRENAGKQFDPELVKAFIEMIS